MRPETNKSDTSMKAIRKLNFDNIDETTPRSSKAWKNQIGKLVNKSGVKIRAKEQVAQEGQPDDFGPATFVEVKGRKGLCKKLVWISKSGGKYPDQEFHFSQQGNTSHRNRYFICVNCISIKKKRGLNGRIPCVILNENDHIIRRNPNTILHICMQERFKLQETPKAQKPKPSYPENTAQENVKKKAEPSKNDEKVIEEIIVETSQHANSAKNKKNESEIQEQEPSTSRASRPRTAKNQANSGKIYLQKHVQEKRGQKTSKPKTKNARSKSVNPRSKPYEVLATVNHRTNENLAKRRRVESHTQNEVPNFIFPRVEITMEDIWIMEQIKMLKEEPITSPVPPFEPIPTNLSHDTNLVASSTESVRSTSASTNENSITQEPCFSNASTARMDRILEAQEDDFELRFKLSDSYCVYGADDIKVEIEDGWIEVKAELIEQHPDEIIRHSFYRKRKLPAEVIVESLSCDIDQGMLIISGKKQLPEKRVLKVNILRSGP